MRLTSRLGSAGLAIYFWAFIIFLFAPLAVLLIFSVNKSPTPTLPLSGFSTKWFPDRVVEKLFPIHNFVLR